MDIKKSCLCDDYQTIFTQLKKEVGYYFYQNKLNTAVVGISGGIDSALVCAIIFYAKEEGVLPKDFKLRGYSLPMGSNTEGEIARAKRIGERYCDEFTEVGLEYIVGEFKHASDTEIRRVELQDQWNKSHNKRVRVGNIRARVRMTFLYDMARRYNGLVLSTDNLTEYMLGFWTLHGDVGDFGPIQELWKTEVFGVAEFIGDGCLTECVEAVPTDGLGVTESDLDQILPDWSSEHSHREGYRAVDKILIHILETGPKYSEEELKDRPVVRRHFASRFKRNNPCNISRELLIAQPTMKYVPF